MSHIQNAIYSFPSNKDLSKALNDLILKASNEANSAQRKFTIALSGGSLASILAAAMHKYDTSNWHFFFADERCVALDSVDSNYLGFVKPVFEPLGVRPEQIHTINPALISDPKKAAEDYQSQLKGVFGEGMPVFDVILLGMGPDGHTCSLFPRHPLCDEKTLYVASIADSPKPPPQRITLTFPVVNSARYCIFVATGAGKADILHRMVDLKQDFPASKGKDNLNVVNPVNGKLYWLVDGPACTSLASVPQIQFRL
jgi:6-phosphogluconolactonase